MDVNYSLNKHQSLKRSDMDKIDEYYADVALLVRGKHPTQTKKNPTVTRSGVFVEIPSTVYAKFGLKV